MNKFFTLIFSILFSVSSFSADIGLLVLKAVVPRIVSLSVVSESVASALDLETTQTDLLVATSYEASNSKTGYTITIFSANLGNLKRVSGAEVFPYTLKISNVTIGLSTAAGTTYTQPATAISGSRDITLSYTGKSAESMVEGAYSDTVTFQIAAR